ncbi:MAG: toll/interleukin-1 receptor domain-containing protein [Balneolaceae bacterium]
MKIFISHSSKDVEYGNALVDLLTGVGINGDHIIFTSNDAYGIPISQNIFNWLKDRISEGPHVLYLLSPDYYTSVACLNEMGAAWIVENQHSMIFTPNFKLDSYEFQNGALDPREIGFFINNQDRITDFIESLKKQFSISNKPVIINQKVREFISRVESIRKQNCNKSTVAEDIGVDNSSVEDKKPLVNTFQENETNTKQVKISTKSKVNKSVNFDQLILEKLTDEEILLFQYIMDTGRYKLGTGWQENNELKNIRTWEEIQELDSTLSKNYSKALRKLEIRNLTEVSDVTSHNNPKEVALVENIQKEILDPSEEVIAKIEEVVDGHGHKEFPF